VTGVIAPASQFVANPEVISASSFGLVYRRLKSTSSTGKVSGLHGTALESTEAVTGTKVQPLSTSTPTTVDVSANLVFKVAFLNSGNFQEVHFPVTLTVVVGGKTVLTKVHNVQSILPQQHLTISFANLALPTSAFGASATVHIAIAKVPGEVTVDNNSASYPVFFSLPSGG
jgi:hypothetical protein